MTSRFFNYRERTDIPSLAWLMSVKSGDAEVKVTHGSDVECRENFFVAGVWAGTFAEGRMDASPYSLCTGARMVEPQLGGVKVN